MAACLTPITLWRKNRNIRDNHTDIVPCGKCPNCIKKRIGTWVYRLQREQEISSSSSFMTYTYSDEHLPFSENGLMTLTPKHHQDFMKRLRKQLHKEGYIQKLKYYAVGEYGDKTHRPHYHSILFNLPDKYIVDESLIENIWNQGKIQVAVANDKTLAYVAGYVNKKLSKLNNLTNNDPLDDRILEFSHMSKGLGKNWLTPAKQKFYSKQLEPYIVEENGNKKALPRYYKDKMFTDKQKLILSEKSKAYAENNYPYRNAEHEVEHKKAEINKFKKNQILTRKKI